MKKALKISGIILGILLSAWLAIVIFVPGLFTYFSVKHRYPNIDASLEEFKIEAVPQTFVTYDIKGLSFKVPRDCTKSETGSIVNYNDEARVAVIKTEESKMALLLEEANYDYDEWECYDYEESDYRHFFNTIGEDMPDDTTELLWFQKDRLNAAMCLHLRGTDRKIFCELAEGKNGAYETENTYKMNKPGFTAYVSENIMDEYAEKKMWTVVLYPDDNDDCHYFVMITGDNLEMKKQIISSIELTED